MPWWRHRTRGFAARRYAQDSVVHLARQIGTEARIRRLGPLRGVMKHWLADWELLVGFVAMAALLVALGVLGLIGNS